MKNLVETFVPSVPVQLEIPTKEGKHLLHFRLTFDFNALSLAEEKLGVSMLTLNPKVWSNMTAKTVSVLLWAGIQGGAATQEQQDYEGDEGLALIRSFLFAANVGPAIEAVNEAYIVVQTEATQKAIREIAAGRDGKPSPNDPAPAEPNA